MSVDQLKLCGTVTVDADQAIGVVIFVFLGRLQPGDRVELAPSSEGRLDWVPIGEVEMLPVVEDVPVLLQEALKSDLENLPFAAHSHYNESGELEISFNR